MSETSQASGIQLSAAGIEEAHARLRTHLFETPLLPSPALSELTGAEVILKAENIQRAGSFKVRGSFNKLGKLVDDGGLQEVTAASAGNHAQGLAYAASIFQVAATIYMPDDAPLAKRRATEALGAEVRIEGANYDEARAASLRHARDAGVTFVDGFDDWDIIEGQGTIAVELVSALGDAAPDYVLVPAGGGGLLAGVLFYLKEVYGDATRVIGIQSDRATAMADSLRSARDGTAVEAELPLLVRTSPTIADGIRIGRPGTRPFEVIRNLVDDIVVVSEESIYESIVHLYESSRLVVEGAGAVGVAALLRERIDIARSSRVVTLLSGGNVDLGAMQKIINAYLNKSGRRVVLRVKVKDAPGHLARVIRVFERERLNVIEILQSQTLGQTISPEYTVFDVVLETDGESQVPRIMAALANEQERMRDEGHEPFIFE